MTSPTTDRGTIDSLPAAPRRAERLRRLAIVLLAVLALSTPAVVAAKVLEVFVRDGCGHCADAKRFLVGFGAQRPDLTIVYRDIDADDATMDDLIIHARSIGRSVPAVPTFVVEGRVFVGFATDAISGPAIAALVDGPSADARAPSLDERLGLPLFSLAIGVLAGVNPCTVWMLMFLLSMLMHLRDRLRIAVLAGTFVVANGAIHLVLLKAWLGAFALAGASGTLSRAVAAGGALLGLLNLKDAVAPGRGPSASIPDAARPALAARARAVLAGRTLGASIAGVLVLAALGDAASLMCTAGLTAILGASLARFDPTPVAEAGYLAIYLAGYLLPSAMVAIAAVALLSGPKMSSATGRWLKGLSGVTMLGLSAWLLAGAP